LTEKQKLPPQSKKKKEKKNCRPCLAALDVKEQGKTFQLNSRRESLPPLHQNIPNPLAGFAQGFD
jgi:hypothetical protein